MIVFSYMCDASQVAPMKPSMWVETYDSVEDFIAKQLEYSEEYEEYNEILGELYGKEDLDMDDIRNIAAGEWNGEEFEAADGVYYTFSVENTEE